MKNAFAFLAITLLVSFSFSQVPDQSKVVAGAARAIEKHAKLSPANAPGCAVGVSSDDNRLSRKP